MAKELFGANGKIVGSDDYFNELHSNSILRYLCSNKGNYYKELSDIAKGVNTVLQEVYKDLCNKIDIIGFIPKQNRTNLIRFVQVVNDVTELVKNSNNKANDVIKILSDCNITSKDVEKSAEVFLKIKSKLSQKKRIELLELFLNSGEKVACKDKDNAALISAYLSIHKKAGDKKFLNDVLSYINSNGETYYLCSEKYIDNLERKVFDTSLGKYSNGNYADAITEALEDIVKTINSDVSKVEDGGITIENQERLKNALSELAYMCIKGANKNSLKNYTQNYYVIFNGTKLKVDLSDTRGIASMFKLIDPYSTTNAFSVKTYNYDHSCVKMTRPDSTIDRALEGAGIYEGSSGAAYFVKKISNGTATYYVTAQNKYEHYLGITASEAWNAVNISNDDCAKLEQEYNKLMAHGASDLNPNQSIDVTPNSSNTVAPSDYLELTKLFESVERKVAAHDYIQQNQNIPDILYIVYILETKDKNEQKKAFKALNGWSESAYKLYESELGLSLHGSIFASEDYSSRPDTDMGSLASLAANLVGRIRSKFPQGSGGGVDVPNGQKPKPPIGGGDDDVNDDVNGNNRRDNQDDEDEDDQDNKNPNNDQIEGAGKLFKNGELFEKTMKLSDGTEVTTIAETMIEGKTLTLKDITIYSNVGDIPNAVGADKFKSALDVLMQQAKSDGFEVLRITGQRAANSTSANPGKLIDMTFKLK